MVIVATLDDGSERTILPQDTTHRLKLQGQAENLVKVGWAFTAAKLGLAEHTYPVGGLKKRFREDLLAAWEGELQHLDCNLDYKDSRRNVHASFEMHKSVPIAV